ncbi:alpha/beta fold hydrolase [Tautonia plasticadhaerens]|uniref:2-hydroxy-6-oxo-6-phenylhexa-2,4-dienoate hydrolase n=1 Tax=Tautonia plasticadhaerens TaxID=2527974 RepID=A0A518GYU6_9BACT|nr:alpha/beta fold hydrolase [Tautonia plasticadhaerens]QDV33769.1 2-hydroxy-6-oxo-6-phenylhexa-2,4-dienoate hydrolase [Tautonia plasticadhaerens]
MKTNGRNFFNLPLALRSYRRSGPLVLVNGLAEQSESWFANRTSWSRHFDVKVPELLVYDGDDLHRHIDGGGEVTIGYLTDRLARYLDEFVQKPPYNLVGSSLGGQILLTYAARHPEKVNKLVLICPSGLHGDENLPVMEGVRRSDYDSLVRSVFHKAQFAGEELVEAIERKFRDRRWKKGVLRTLRGTVGHSVGDLLERVPHQTLLIWGLDDRVIADIPGSIRAAERMPRARQVAIPRCGHAPQIERAGLVNKLVVRFLKDKLVTIPPMLSPVRSRKARRAAAH